MNKQKTVLITGAAGNLGSKLRQHLSSKPAQYELRLLDIKSTDRDVIQVDLSQWGPEAYFHDVDVVVHFAANPSDKATWPELQAPNIDATINTFSRAYNGNVTRFVFASSNHVMGGYKDKPEVQKLTIDLPSLPGTRFSFQGRNYDSQPYAATKLFGERLGKGYADPQMSVIAVRIGWVPHGKNSAREDLTPENEDWFHKMWLSDRDFCHLMERCIEVELPRYGDFAIVNGMSANPGMVWDIEHTKRLLGYQPQD